MSARAAGLTLLCVAAAGLLATGCDGGSPPQASEPRAAPRLEAGAASSPVAAASPVAPAAARRVTPAAASPVVPAASTPEAPPASGPVVSAASGPVASATAPETPAAARPVAPAASAPAEPRPHARGAPAGKPAAFITLEHELLDVPQLGVALRVRVTAVPRGALTGLTIEAHASASALVLATPPFEAPVDLPAGEAVSRTFTVYPLAEGAHRLSVVAAGFVDGEPQAAQLTVPIRLGPAGDEAGQGAAGRGTEGAVGTDARGERIRSLPARER